MSRDHVEHNIQKSGRYRKKRDCADQRPGLGVRGRSVSDRTIEQIRQTMCSFHRWQGVLEASKLLVLRGVFPVSQSRRSRIVLVNRFVFSNYPGFLFFQFSKSLVFLLFLLCQFLLTFFILVVAFDHKYTLRVVQIPVRGESDIFCPAQFGRADLILTHL